MKDDRLTLARGHIQNDVVENDVEEIPRDVEDDIEEVPRAGDVKKITELFDEAYAKDPIPNDVLGQLRSGQRRSKQLSLAECKEDANGRLLYRERLYVPNHTPLKLRLVDKDKGKKVDPKWKGPYRIAKVTKSGVSVLLEDLCTGGKSGRYIVDDIKVYLVWGQMVAQEGYTRVTGSQRGGGRIRGGDQRDGGGIQGGDERGEGVAGVSLQAVWRNQKV